MCSVKQKMENEPNKISNKPKLFIFLSDSDTGNGLITVKATTMKR